MPVADEKLKEKIPFTVYTMMLLLSFAATCTAIYFLHQELHVYWYAGELPGQTDDEGRPIDPPPHAEYLTEINDDYEAWPPPEKPSQLFNVTARDIREYAILRLGETEGILPDNYENYPEWFNWQNPIDIHAALEDIDPIVNRIPEDLKARMVEEYRDPELERPVTGAPEGGEEGAAPDGEAAAPDGGDAEAPPAE